MENEKQNPLTLEQLAKYNHEVLFPYMESRFATKDEFANFKDEYKKDFSDLQKSVDAYAVKADKYLQETTMLGHQNSRYEKWFHLLAEKLGIKLEY